MAAPFNVENFESIEEVYFEKSGELFSHVLAILEYSPASLCVFPSFDLFFISPNITHVIFVALFEITAFPPIKIILDYF